MGIDTIIPESAMRFALLPKLFLPRMVLNGPYADYLKTLTAAHPLFVSSETVWTGLLPAIRGINAAWGDDVFLLASEPSVDDADALKRRLSGTDALIAIGGGSVLDLAKSVRLVSDVPLIAIPTTPATGSEVTPYALLTDTAAKKKTLVRGYRLLPDAVVLDPSLLSTLSSAALGYALFDILGHSLEALVSRLATPLSDVFALDAIRRMRRALAVWTTPATTAMLQDIQLAGYAGGLAQSMASVGMAHAFAHHIGARYGVPHARAVSLFLENVVRVNATHGAPYGKAADAGVGTPDEIAALCAEIRATAGLPSERPIAPDMPMNEAVMLIQKDVCTPTNPCRWTANEIADVLVHGLSGTRI
jgi:alcohol dehydrogenase class IV